MNSENCWNDCMSAWRWVKDAYGSHPLIEWLKTIPDPRSERKKPHELAEVFVCIIMGLLNGKTKLRRIYRWCARHVDGLRQHMPFENGIPSVPTMSRIPASVDEDLVSYAIMNWIGEICDTRKTHLAIDGKGLRAATRRLRDERTPYILNAIDVATKLLVGQLPIPEKTNEITAIPKLVESLNIEGSLITIDAIGTTRGIMGAIHKGSGNFLLQVKKNCPALYGELTALFLGLEEEKERDAERFAEKYDGIYDEAETFERNRERYEYREYQAFNDPSGIKALQEERPYIKSVGYSKQTRILKIEDGEGNDITPSLDEFLKNGSRKQPHPVEGDALGNDIQRFGLIASVDMTAKEMMDYKRSHWAVETSLHYVLDETFGEDKSTIKTGRNTMSMFRKCAYNIARLLQMKDPKNMPNIPDVLDTICDDVEIGLKFIFEPIASLY